MIDLLICDVLCPLAVFGGLAGIIAAFGWSRAERIRVEGKASRLSHSETPSDAVLAELKALQQQIGDMQNTSHQFDLSFDESLTRLEQRVNRLETKAAVLPSPTTETPGTLRNGQTR